MSQEKVDLYKESKKTRKADVAKKKKVDKLTQILYWVVGVVIVAALIFGIALTIHNTKEQTGAEYQNTSKIIDDYAGILDTEDAE